MRHPEIDGRPLSTVHATASAASVLAGYVVEDQVGFLMRRANQRHTSIFLDGMTEAGLTPTQFTALVKIVELGRITQNHLGRLSAMDPATIQGVVRRLIDRDLVTRSAEPLDRRTIVLAPTKAGVDLAARAVVAARRITRATLEPLTADEQHLLLSLLRKLG